MTRPSTNDGYLHTIWRMPGGGGELTLVAQFVGDADWYRRGDTAETAAERYLTDCYRPGPVWTDGRYRVDVVDCQHRPVVTIERAVPENLRRVHSRPAIRR